MAAPLTLAELRGDLAHLHHGQARSRGTGALYRQYQTQLSRRDLAALLAAARRTLARERETARWHVTGRCRAWSGRWMTPN